MISRSLFGELAKRRPLRANLFWPSAALVAIALIIFVLGASALLRQFDRVANVRETSVMSNGLAQRLNEVSQMVVPQTVWDDAVANLDVKYNPVWAAANIGKYLNQTNGFDQSFILDRADRPVFAAEESSVRGARMFEPFRKIAQPLVASVRRQEARRGPLVRSAEGNMLAKPIQASSLARIGDRFTIVTATLVQPDFGKALPLGPRSPIVLTAMTLDQRFLDALERRFLVTDLHLLVGQRNSFPDQNFVLVRDAHGRVLGALLWRQRLPGVDLLHRLFLPIFLVVAALASAALLLIRRNQRLANDLIDGEARAARLAFFDIATGLPNRASLYQQVELEIDRLKSEPQANNGLAVHCIDLDRFNEVNEFLGHAAGDQLIREAAHRFAGRCGERAFLARLSSDEFVVVQPNATKDQAAALAAELCGVLVRPIELETGRIFAGCSIGVSLLRDPKVGRCELLRQADLALHRAKQDGGDCFRFFEREMDTSLKMRRMLQADLRDAIATDSLTMVYQPQADRNGTIVGVEALMRWDHPERGAISPSVFIPVAEESGLISDLGMLAFRHVFRDAKAWAPLKVAINVSAKQLGRPDFVETLANLVDEYDVAAQNFELEITEGVLLREDPVVQDTLASLRAMGFGLALDDFGTGYSALSYLRRYPIDKIKIDRSFVMNLGIDREAQAVVAAIVKLARALKLSVIAEGVETTDQRDRLAAVGCSHIQGFLFSKPISAREVGRILNQPAAWPAANAA
jgi:diguanylate cyclase (GGDEF)-like protein